jgi:hypothetical protein
METPEECRRHAEELEETAQSISLKVDRERLLAMAREWRARAEHLEGKSRDEVSTAKPSREIAPPQPPYKYPPRGR